MPEADKSPTKGTNPLQDLPWGRLTKAGQDLLSAAAERAAGAVGDQAKGLIGRLTGYAADGGGDSGLMAAVTGGKKLTEGAGPVKAMLSAGKDVAKKKVGEVLGVGGSAGSGSAKVVNIVEQCDVGLPLRVVYDQWTCFEDYPSFTRKVESVEQESDEKINWRAQIFLSHRSWESTIQEQVPDTRIVWHSTGAKGSVDGTVTFHEITPTMTRILLVLEYHPQGFFEKTANLWRAQGRRVRSDFKHIKRHMMTRTILEQDEVEGWRGEIRDREVVRTHEDAVEQEQADREAEDGDAEDDGYDDRYAEDDGYDDEDDGYDDGYDDEDESAADGPSDESAARRPEPARRSRRDSREQRGR